MKTKHILTAMLLPALFAACTSDEILEGTTDNLQGRALLPSNFGVTVNSDANTRLAWNGATWAFEPGDKFGAGLVDGGTRYTVNNNILTNYIFSQTSEGAAYTTTSQMVEGVYFFYSYPKFADTATRGEFKFDLGKQSADLTSLETAKKTVTDNQLFISSLYNLDSKTANVGMNLTFYSYWNVAAVVLKNETAETLKMSQIILESGSNDFTTNGTVDMTSIATFKGDGKHNSGYTCILNEETGKYEWPEDATLDGFKIANFASSAKATKTSTIALNCNNFSLAAGKEVTAYIVVPASEVSNLSVKVVVNNAEGKSKELHITAPGESGSATSSTLAKVVFNRTMTKALLGLTTGGEMKPFGLTKDNLKDLDSYYVDNEADLVAIMDAHQNEGDVLPIFNFGDLKVTDNIVNGLTKNNVNLEFKKAIEVTATKGTLKNVTFAEKATFKGAGSLALGEGVVITKGLEVAAGEVIVNSAMVTATSNAIVVNGGKLKVNKTLLTPFITAKKGEITFNAGTKATPATQAIDAGLTFALDDAAKEGDVKLTVNEYNTLTVGAALTIPAKAQVTNNGTITLGNFVVTNAGTINNIGTFNGADATTTAFANTGKITNTGVLNTVNNTGSIVMASGAAELRNLKGTGTVDNTLDGYITDVTESNVVFATITASKTGTFAIPMECNKVILDGGMTWTNAAALLLGVTAIEVKNATIAGAGVTTAFPATVTSVVLDGATIAADVTFNQGVTVMGATNFNATVTMPDEVAKTMTIGADVAAAAGDAVAQKIAKAINERTSLKISTGGKITCAGTTNGYTIVNNAKVYNRGTVEKLAELVALVEGAEWFYNAGTAK